MFENIDYTIIGCDNEKEFLKLIGNPILYNNKLLGIIEDLNPSEFNNESDYFLRISDLNLLKFNYKNLFYLPNSGAEYHWHFLEGFEAFSNGTILPALLSYICGIEASLRSTLYMMKTNPSDRLYVRELMNMDLIYEAYDKGLPISTLAFSNENNFIDSVQKKNKIRLINVRNDLMHGNIRSYCEKFEEDRIFTPTHLLNDLIETIIISRKWIAEISEFKKIFNKDV
ncbi:hypothetical protein [Acinetobacter seifertii]|uniref:hypothetical protein n=1 Tax=Acinetobacter seifertii TaxID=1530123 RepID=UPI0032B5CC23